MTGTINRQRRWRRRNLKSGNRRGFQRGRRRRNKPAQKRHHLWRHIAYQQKLNSAQKRQLYQKRLVSKASRTGLGGSGWRMWRFNNQQVATVKVLKTSNNRYQACSIM